MKKLLTVAAATLTVLGVAACAAPTTSPAPVVTVTEVAPAPTLAEPAAPSERDRLAAMASEVLGVKVYEDDPILDPVIIGTQDLCFALADGRKAGMPADLALGMIYDGSGGDEIIFTLIVGGLKIYCPTEFDWLASAVDLDTVA